MKYIAFFILFSLGIMASAKAQCTQFLLDCPSDAITNCDLTPNSALYWNDPLFQENVANGDDLAEAELELWMSAKDSCAGSNLQISYVLFLDLDGDNVMETAVPSWNLPAPGTVNFGNAGNANYSGGTPVYYDSRPVPTEEKYQFALETTISGHEKSAYLRWSTLASPGTFINAQLPHGTHKLVWSTNNGLGETHNCDWNFKVKDCKAPTVVCLNGLAVNIQSDGLIQLHVSDILQYVEDNTTPSAMVQLGIRKSGTGTGFPVDQNGNPQTSIIFNCSELGTQSIEIWARDQAGNADYCETYCIVSDNNGNCSGGPLSITVCVNRPCDNAVVTGVELGVPGMNLGLNADGCMVFTTTASNNPFTIQAQSNNHPLNGVTVLDLRRISRHILGLEPLSSYHLIAADANKSGSVTSIDIVELRKQILGIYTDLPNNSSWRFISKSFQFPNPQNPFQTGFPEFISFPNMTASVNADFYAIKIGDVDCSAWPDASLLDHIQVDDREKIDLILPDLRLHAGETREISLKTGDEYSWSALQASLAYDPAVMELEWIEGSEFPNMRMENVGTPTPGVFNLTWFDDNSRNFPAQTEFARFRVQAKRAFSLREAISINKGEKAMRSVAYDLDNQEHALSLQFRDESSLGFSNADYIGVAQPNPASQGFNVPVQLSETSPVLVQMFDLSGRMIWSADYQLDKGKQYIEVPASAMPLSGVYVCKVQANTMTHTERVTRL